MADEPEQLDLGSRDQETAAQDKALGGLTDHVGFIWHAEFLALLAGLKRSVTCLQVEEKELDANKVHNAMNGLAASQKADREAQRLRSGVLTSPDFALPWHAARNALCYM